MLQEMLTVKSDDIRGRLKTYERIVKGENLAKPGVPESFRVLIKELQGLGLDVEIKYSDGSFGELVLSEEDDDSGRETRRHVSFKPDSTVDSLEEDFGLSRSPKSISDSDLFHEHAAEYSPIELHETDEEKEAEVLRNQDTDLFNDVAPKKDDREDDI